ncbi:MAG: hypothetical protein ABJB11_17930 [Ferruginibacter sp.]
METGEVFFWTATINNWQHLLKDTQGPWPPHNAQEETLLRRKLSDLILRSFS